MFKVSLICVGRAKPGAERDLAVRYLDRAQRAARAAGVMVECRDIDESRARRAEDRKAEEAKAIATFLAADALLAALDETGQAIDSESFAAIIGQSRDAGRSSLALVIGGPDGLEPAWRQSAAHVLSFGAMTWPHQLVRIMAAEQIYRAVTILTGHPYHRA